MSSATRSKPTRWIMLDDTSPEFNYLGSWSPPNDGSYPSFLRNDSDNTLNSNGELYRGTTHGTTQPASFSITYIGGQFELIGTIARSNNELGFEWHCFVDGKEVQNIANIKKFPPDNNWPLCADEDSPSANGRHTLLVNISAIIQQPFWFDWMRYTPTPTTSLENRTIRYDRPDAAVVSGFSVAWDMAFGTTTIPGASFKWEFIGTSFAWYGSLKLASLGVDPPTTNVQMGTYQIDNGPNIPINCPMVTSRANWWNQKFFETERLPMRKHNISVKYTGGVYPLTLDYLLVQNGTLKELIANASRVQRRRTTIIVASVIPAVAVMLAILLAFFMYRRRMKLHNRERVHDRVPQDLKQSVEEQSQPPPTAPESTTPFPFVAAQTPFMLESQTFKQRSAQHSHSPSNTSYTSRQLHNIEGLEVGGLVMRPELQRRLTVASEAPPSYIA